MSQIWVVTNDSFHVGVFESCYTCWEVISIWKNVSMSKWNRFNEWRVLNKILFSIKIYAGLNSSSQDDLHNLDNYSFISSFISSNGYAFRSILKSHKYLWSYIYMYICRCMCIDRQMCNMYILISKLPSGHLKKVIYNKNNSIIFQQENIFYSSSYLIRLGPLI
jgi:hypothetical protein